MFVAYFLICTSCKHGWSRGPGIFVYIDTAEETPHLVRLLTVPIDVVIGVDCKLYRACACASWWRLTVWRRYEIIQVGNSGVYVWTPNNYTTYRCPKIPRRRKLLFENMEQPRAHSWLFRIFKQQFSSSRNLGTAISSIIVGSSHIHAAVTDLYNFVPMKFGYITLHYITDFLRWPK